MQKVSVQCTPNLIVNLYSRGIPAAFYLQPETLLYNIKNEVDRNRNYLLEQAQKIISACPENE